MSRKPKSRSKSALAVYYNTAIFTSTAEGYTIILLTREGKPMGLPHSYLMKRRQFLRPMRVLTRS